MPRSGTTLVEQILASHPQVHGAGELKQIQRMVLGIGKGPSQGPHSESMVSRVTPAQIQRQAANHLAFLRSLAPNALRVVDKMPDNFAHLELIWTLFPKRGSFTAGAIHRHLPILFRAKFSLDHLRDKFG